MEPAPTPYFFSVDRRVPKAGEEGGGVQGRAGVEGRRVSP